MAALALLCLEAASAPVGAHVGNGEAETPKVTTDTPRTPIELLAGPVVILLDRAGQPVARRGEQAETGVKLSEADLVAAIANGNPSEDRIAWLWNFLADDDNAAFVRPEIVKALASVTRTARTREAMWSELSALSRTPTNDRSRQRTLLDLFERQRQLLLPLLPPIKESEGGGDEMARLMTSSRLFGDDIWQSLFDMVVRNPGAVARMIERERERGRPVKWEYQGFEGMMRWKEAHLVAGAPQMPKTLEELDAASETFVTIFNALHSLNDWYRKQMLKGLGPVQLFNTAVGGEQELYRLGTSGYRDHLHPLILDGIRKAGSFEAFLEAATPSWLTERDPGARSKRGLVFVRIASAFGLLDSVLETLREPDRFIAETLAAVADPRTFNAGSTVAIDMLTGEPTSTLSRSFRKTMIDRLYALYRGEVSPGPSSVYGSMLSAYQTVTGDRREPAIDRKFPVGADIMELPFTRLFTPDGRSGHIHRMFMRLHDDIDAAGNWSSFRILMRKLGAQTADHQLYSVYRLANHRRAIEIYVNRPSETGIRKGIDAISHKLAGRTVHTVIGRGHTGIIIPLQVDTRRLLGPNIDRVAALIVGSCGGDASVRDLVTTFGFVPIVTTKATGRQLFNDAIIRHYIDQLMAMRPNQRLVMTSLVGKALAPYLSPRANEELREDAALYRVNVATVLAARLFDRHVRPHIGLQKNVSR